MFSAYGVMNEVRDAHCVMRAIHVVCDAITACYVMRVRRVL